MRMLLILRYEWRLKSTGKVLIGQMIGSQPGVDLDLWVPCSEMWTLAGIGSSRQAPPDTGSFPENLAQLPLEFPSL
jgi:hypothetical protein